MRNSWILSLVVASVSCAIVLIRQRRVPAAAPRPAEPARLPDPDPDDFMLRGLDFYVRLDPARRDAMLSAAREAVGADATLYDQGTHAVVLWHDFHPPAELLERLSRELRTEVIWLAFQKQVDAFGYERWVDGTRLRRLTYGCFEQERTWEEVDGSPEAWEVDALFDVGMRRDRRLEVGSTEPSIFGRDAAEAVATAYSLPGWD